MAPTVLQTETFKFSTDSALEAEVQDVVGLYLEPPAGTILLSVDEKTQIQALDRNPADVARSGQPQASARSRQSR